MTQDVIDRLAGIAPGSPLEALRARRPQARVSAQESWRLLLEPEAPGGFSLAERRAVAFFVALLQGDSEASAFYEDLLRDIAAAERLRALAARSGAPGPYGAYPAGPLSREDEPGPRLRISGPDEAALGGKLSRGLEHAHLLTLHPRDASAAALRRLEAAGWSAEAVVTLSQLASFLAFQIRAAVGLRVLAAHPA